MRGSTAIMLGLGLLAAWILLESIDEREESPASLRTSHPTFFEQLKIRAMRQGLRWNGDDLPKKFLQNIMESLVRREEYESAALIRDELRRMA